MHPPILANLRIHKECEKSWCETSLSRKKNLISLCDAIESNIYQNRAEKNVAKVLYFQPDTTYKDLNEKKIRYFCISVYIVSAFVYNLDRVSMKQVVPGN